MPWLTRDKMHLTIGDHVNTNVIDLAWEAAQIGRRRDTPVEMPAYGSIPGGSGAEALSMIRSGCIWQASPYTDSVNFGPIAVA